jgi:hypothetical protein
MKPGTSYEQFVANLYRAIIMAGESVNNIQVETNKIITDRNGCNREFDVYWEYELAGFIYKTVIECKDYNSTIDIIKIDALVGKIQDLPEINKAIFATKKGYQSGAQKKAEQNNIDLLIVREQNDSDWEDSEGNQFLRYVKIGGQLILPAHITRFTPVFDIDWLKKNTTIDFSKTDHISFNDLDNTIIIEDNVKNEKYSLYDLRHKQLLDNTEKYGTFVKKIKFDDGFIRHKDEVYRIKGYDVEYTVPQPIEMGIDIDFSDEFLGVIEYLQKGRKVEIMKNGKVRETIVHCSGKKNKEKE